MFLFPSRQKAAEQETTSTTCASQEDLEAVEGPPGVTVFVFLDDSP